MATKLSNSLRNSISAEKKNVNERKTNSFTQIAKKAKKKYGVKTTKSTMKNTTSANARKLSKVKVIKNVTNASTNNMSKNMINLISTNNQQDQYLPKEMRAKFSTTIGNSLRNMVEVGCQLNDNCIDALKVVNDDLKEYLESLPVIMNMADLIKLNLGYISLLRNRGNSIIASNVRTLSKYCPIPFFNNYTKL